MIQQHPRGLFGIAKKKPPTISITSLVKDLEPKKLDQYLKRQQNYDDAPSIGFLNQKFHTYNEKPFSEQNLFLECGIVLLEHAIDFDAHAAWRHWSTIGYYERDHNGHSYTTVTAIASIAMSTNPVAYELSQRMQAFAYSHLNNVPNECGKFFDGWMRHQPKFNSKISYPRVNAFEFRCWIDNIYPQFIKEWPRDFLYQAITKDFIHSKEDARILLKNSRSGIQQEIPVDLLKYTPLEGSSKNNLLHAVALTNSDNRTGLLEFLKESGMQDNVNSVGISGVDCIQFMPGNNETKHAAKALFGDTLSFEP